MAGTTGIDANPFRAAGCRGGGHSMVIESEVVGRRRHFKGLGSLNQRLAEEVQRLQNEARTAPPGIERDRLLQRVRQAETASHINEWLSSPVVQAPKQYAKARVHPRQGA
jgi:hypothetical protein